MAGLYPDSPSRRMAWDADGTVAVYSRSGDAGVPQGTPPSGAWIEMNAGDRETINNEDVTDLLFGGFEGDPRTWVALIFPEPREIDGAHVNVSQGDWTDTSGDTTNGTDGTWVSAAYTGVNGSTSSESYRDDITSMAIPTERGFRFYVHTNGASRNNWRSHHIYGVISPGETPDRVLFLDTENSDAVFTKTLDYAEVPRGQTQTRTFKLKNNSGSKTINTIQITAEDLFLNAGGWYTFGDNDVSYQATFSVGNLGAGATKLLYVKQVVPDGETLGLQAARFKASHASVT